jgi:hypothetical protein
MSTRPAKRDKVDNNLHVQQSSVPKILARLSKPSLCSLALTWLSEQHPPTAPRSPTDEDSDESDQEEEEQQRDLNKLYQHMRDNTAVTKSKVVARIRRDWVSSCCCSLSAALYHTLTRTDIQQRQGFTYRQIAQLDLQCSFLPSA